VCGFDTREQSMEVRRRVGYLPEHNPLYTDLYVKEYLAFVAGIYKLTNVAARVKEMVGLVGLDRELHKKIGQLSRGYRQRVGLAQALVHDPAVLILDEPTTGLDPNQIVEIRELIKRLGREKTVIFSTHILSEVSATCDRIIIINNGKIVGEGTPDELASKAGSKEVIYVKIKGPREAVLEKLRALENVAGVKEKDRESDEIFGYEIEPKEGVDLREQLSMMVMHNNWSILEFNRKTVSLEDVFRELTK
jgi:ABC-2 type transport system ATP-binding protein